MLFYTHLHYLNNGGRVPIAKANKRISAPYSIWKILAHAQYYVKLARVSFSRDFFATNKLIVKILGKTRQNHTIFTPFLVQKCRISTPYLIRKILAHAQCYVKLASGLFSRDFFFANKQSDCKDSRQKSPNLGKLFNFKDFGTRTILLMSN